MTEPAKTATFEILLALWDHHVIGQDRETTFRNTLYDVKGQKEEADMMLDALKLKGRVEIVSIVYDQCDSINPHHGSLHFLVTVTGVAQHELDDRILVYLTPEEN